jgi:hypothetical protein
MELPRIECFSVSLTSDDGEVLLTAVEAAALARVKPKTLANWRCRNYGPPYSKLGSGSRGRIRYRKADVLAWLHGQPASAA